MEKFIISRDESIYEAFPDVVLTENGRLICVFTECVHHVDRHNTRIVYMISDDRGRSWTEKRALTSVQKTVAPRITAREFLVCQMVGLLLSAIMLSLARRILKKCH